MAVTDADWLQAQYSVLGAALIEPQLVPKVLTQTAVSDYSGPCQNIYKAMRKLFVAGTAVDVVSLAAAMGAEYRDMLVQLMDITPTAANLDSYIALCREQSKVLAVRALCRQMAEEDSSDRLRSLLERANSIMVDKPSLKIVTMADALKSFMARHTRERSYLTWPVPELNDHIYAELGDFLIIAGYPSSGKSAWALQCAWHWAKTYKVGFFSLETSDEKLFDRQMASLTSIGMERIKRNQISPDGWNTVGGMSSEIVSRNLDLIPAAGMSPADVRAVTMMRGYQIILIDYLQLLQSHGNNRTEQVTAISLALHTLAQSMGVTVCALSQLKRQGPSGDSPDMSSLRESGQIEQDADLIQMLYLEKKDSPDGNRIMKIAKNKEGTCPKILLAFDGAHQTFSKAKVNFSAMNSSARRKPKKTPVIQDGTDGQMQLLPNDTPVPFECPKEANDDATTSAN